MNNPYSFSIDQMNGIVEDTYAKIINECENLKKNTNCPNEQVVALLSVIASNYATKTEKKENYFSFLVEKISKIIPNLDKNIDHKEIGTPKTHKKFLGRYEGSYGPIPNQKLLGLLPMPFNTTKIKNLYCVGDSCFPGQGLNAVAFSGYACAHKIGSKLNINSFNLPD